MTTTAPPALRVGQWVQFTPEARAEHNLPKARGCIEQLLPGKAWVRIPVQGWPFPYCNWLPRVWLIPAAAPRKQKLSGKIEA